MKIPLARSSLGKDLMALGGHKPVWRAILLIITMVCGLGILADFYNIIKFGQFDLRNRVVGARVMLQGENPYTDRWHPNEPTTLLDPFVGTTGSISGVTVTPAVLAIHAPMAGLSYRLQKLIWLGIQYLLFAGLIWIAMKRAVTVESKAMVFLVGIMISCSVIWRMHVERGQVYILYSFCAALFITSLSRRGTLHCLIYGAILGLLVCLRPNMVLLGLPLLIYRRWMSVVGAAGGIALGYIIPCLFSPTVWTEYYHIMMQYAGAHHGEGQIVVPTPFEMPEIIEGIKNMGTYAWFGDGNTSLKGAFTSRQIHPSNSFFIGVLILGGLAWLITLIRLKYRNAPIEFCALKSLGFILFVGLVLPIRRGAYSDVILLTIVLLFLAIQSTNRAFRPWEWVLLLGAWVFSAPFPPWVSAGFRGPEFQIASASAILLWIWLTPWQVSEATDCNRDPDIMQI